jgi:hypothetical protein
MSHFYLTFEAQMRRIEPYFPLSGLGNDGAARALPVAA